MEYASTVRDPSTKQLQSELDIVQNSEIRFICKLKVRNSVTQALQKLNIQTLVDRCKTSRRDLLQRLLSSEENHGPLIIESYDKLMTTRTSIHLA